MIQNVRQTGRNIEKKKLVWWSLILLKAENKEFRMKMQLKRITAFECYHFVPIPEKLEPPILKDAYHSPWDWEAFIYVKL